MNFTYSSIALGGYLIRIRDMGAYELTKFRSQGGKQKFIGKNHVCDYVSSPPQKMCTL